MPLCVINYPTLRQEDFDWIQRIRQQHDRLFYKVIAPHFTLVFPTDKVTEANLIEHVARIAGNFQPFEVIFRCAILGDPSFMDHAHVFLVPDEGFSHLIRLHNQLYTKILKSELRLDLPYIPHVGIANTHQLEESQNIVNQLNAQDFEIKGRVEKLDIIGYDGKKTWGIKTCSLTDSTL